MYKNEEEKQNAKMRDLMRWHDERVSSIQKANIEATKAYEENIKEWKISDEDAMYDLNEIKEELSSALSKYYEGDIIYPKYRNLPALTTIYEYLSSGRCSKLTGSDGAYNLYESELRQNIVISQLNTIIMNLEQIRQNQYTLYQEMVKINQNTQEIRQELSTIKGCIFDLTELVGMNAYFNGVTALCSSAMSFYNRIT